MSVCQGPTPVRAAFARVIPIIPPAADEPVTKDRRLGCSAAERRAGKEPIAGAHHVENGGGGRTRGLTSAYEPAS